MKLKIETDFRDKYDKKVLYKTGEIVDFAEDRAKELLADKRNVVSKVEEAVEEAVEEEKPKRKSNKKA